MHILRNAALIIAAMIGSAIIVSLLTMLTLSLTPYGIRPEELVPSAETHAMLTGTDPALAAIWKHLTGKAMPASPDTSSAYIVTGTGSAGTAVFERKKSGEHYDTTLGAYGIRLTEPSLATFIGKSNANLSTSSAFRAIGSRFPQHASWVFLKQNILPKPQTMFDAIILTGVAGNGFEAMGIRSAANGWMLGFYDTSMSSARWNAPEMLPDVADPILKLSMTNASAFWKHALQSLPEGTAAIVEGFLQKTMADTFGTGVSTAYDIEPLLEYPASLQLSASGGGVQFLIAGSRSDERALQRSLMKLHTLFKDSLPTTRVVHRVLDKRFSATDVREDPLQILQEERMLHDWAITVTRSDEYGRTLVSAIQGNTFLMSNDVATLERAISASQIALGAPRSQTPGSMFLGGGSADIPRLRALLQASIADAGTSTLPLGDTVSWGMERNGRLRMLLVHTAANGG